MTKNSDIRQYGKVCTISGKRFNANVNNFYINNKSPDGLNPYHKSFDKFRRVNEARVEKVRELINLINQ